MIIINGDFKFRLFDIGRRRFYFWSFELKPLHEYCDYCENKVEYQADIIMLAMLGFSFYADKDKALHIYVMLLGHEFHFVLKK